MDPLYAICDYALTEFRVVSALEWAENSSALMYVLAKVDSSYVV